MYTLLTARPDNRWPLQWERNYIEALMIEGVTFNCPWTRKSLTVESYDLDHLLPLAVYPVNELWHLLPADPGFNRHTKRDKLPSAARLVAATPLIAESYGHYGKSKVLSRAVREDAAVRFADLPTGSGKGGAEFAPVLAESAVQFMKEVASARNVCRF